MSKYPVELRFEALKWFGLKTDKEDTTRQITDRIFAMRKVGVTKEPKELRIYSSIELAEMIKDVDRA